MPKVTLSKIKLNFSGSSDATSSLTHPAPRADILLLMVTEAALCVTGHPCSRQGSDACKENEKATYQNITP